MVDTLHLYIPNISKLKATQFNILKRVNFEKKPISFFLCIKSYLMKNT